MRTTMLRGALTFVFLLTLSVATSFAQSRAEGTVVDLDKKPVEGAVVTFEAQFQKLSREAKTNNKGYFIFIGLPTGRYKITAKKDDTIDTVNADISGTQKRVIDFTLRPIGGVVVKTSSGPPVPPELMASAIAAITAVQGNRPDEAVEKLQEVIAARPKCYDCYTYLGAMYYQLRKNVEAEAAFNKAVEILPTSEGYVALTRFYRVTDRPDMVEAANKRYTDLTGNKIDDIAFSDALSNSTTAAVAAAAAAAKAAGPNPTELYNEGAKLWNEGNHEGAKPKFLAAVNADPSNALAIYMLANAHVALGEYAEARTAFERYLKLAPNGDKANDAKTSLKALQSLIK